MSEENVGTVQSNSSFELKESPFELPLVDAHMHIQSNDIAPLPIMKHIPRYLIANKIFNLLNFNRINYVELSFRKDDRKYDYVPPIRENKEALSNFLFFSGFLTEKTILGAISKGVERGFIYKFLSSGSIYKNGEEIYKTSGDMGSEGINDVVFMLKKIKNWNERQVLTNLAAITEYGKVCRQSSYTISCLYFNEPLITNLGYRSRWSPKKEVNTNDIDEAQQEREDLISERQIPINFRWYQKATCNIQMWPFFSRPTFACIMGMELFYAHYWGAYGIPIYIENKEDHEIYMIDNQPNNLSLPYDIEKNKINDVLNKRKNFSDLAQSNFFYSDTEHYSHFLKKIPSTEVVQYESHTTHIKYQEYAALKHPFSFFLFYHLDPRRFFAPITDIKKNHDFYVPNSSGYYEKNENIAANLSITQQENIFTLQDNIETVKTLLRNSIFHGIKLYVALGYPPYINVYNESKKIFPRLKPTDYQKFKNFLDFCADEKIPITCHGSPQGMTIADSEIYLKEFLKRNKLGKWTQKRRADFLQSGIGLYLGLGLIDDFSSPDSWSIELSQIRKPLKLCLAHFGGKDFLWGKYLIADDSEKAPYSWQKRLAKLIEENKNHQIYTDLSNYAFEEINFSKTYTQVEFNAIKVALSENIGNADTIMNTLFRKKTYHDGSYVFETIYDLELIDITNYNDSIIEYINKVRFAIIKSRAKKEVEKFYKSQKNALNGNKALKVPKSVEAKLEIASDNLARLLNKYPILRFRIMYGTDYPMFETSIKGVARYRNLTFMFYQLVSEKLEEKWDVWHQFCIINPLNFLGLLKDKNGTSCNEYSRFNKDSDFFTIDVEKFQKIKNGLTNINESLTDSDKRAKLYKLDNQEKLRIIINNKYKSIQKEYMDIKIPNANKIVDKNNKLIISQLKS